MFKFQKNHKIQKVSVFKSKLPEAQTILAGLNFELLEIWSPDEGNDTEVWVHAKSKKTIHIIVIENEDASRDDVVNELIDILLKPSQRPGSLEAFRGFINLFDDYLATDLFDKVSSDIHLIWGEKDPWESLEEAKYWKNNYSTIKSLHIIDNVGHCPHDENPERTNYLIQEIIQETK